MGVQLRTRRSYTAGDAAVGESGAASVLQALELLAVEGSSAFIAVDVIVVGIVVVVAVVSFVNYSSQVMSFVNLRR